MWLLSHPSFFGRFPAILKITLTYQNAPSVNSSCVLFKYLLRVMQAVQLDCSRECRDMGKLRLHDYILQYNTDTQQLTFRFSAQNDFTQCANCMFKHTEVSDLILLYICFWNEACTITQWLYCLYCTAVSIWSDDRTVQLSAPFCSYCESTHLDWHMYCSLSSLYILLTMFLQLFTSLWFSHSAAPTYPWYHNNCIDLFSQTLHLPWAACWFGEISLFSHLKQQLVLF